MKLPQLEALYVEMRRLFIAGSGLAAGDPALNRLLPQLTAMGGQSPAIARLEERVRGLLAANGEEAAYKLAELGALLHAILYTQGDSGAEGALEPIKGLGSAGESRVSYRRLTVLLEALAERKSGRLAVIREAHADGVFRDFRTYFPAIGALSHVPEIADYVADLVMPDLGAQIVPLLRRSFDLKGGKGDARKLRALHRLAGEAELPLVEQAAAQGSIDVRVEAVGLLGSYERMTPLVIGFAADSRKEIRVAAYSALAALAARGSDAAADRLFEALTGKDREPAAEAARQCPSERLTHHIDQYLRKLLADLAEPPEYGQSIAGAKDESEKAALQLVKREEARKQEILGGMQALLRALEGKRGSGLFEPLRDTLACSAFASHASSQLREYPARLLLELENTAADAFVIEYGSKRDKRLIGFALHAAARALPAPELFERFSPELKNRTGGAAKLLTAAMKEQIMPLWEAISTGGTAVPPVAVIYRQAAMQADESPAVSRAEPLPVAFRDRRWLARLAEADEAELLSRFFIAIEPEQEITAWLLDKLTAQEPSSRADADALPLLLGLFAAGCGQAEQLLLRVTRTQAASNSFSLPEQLVRMLRLLRASAAPELETMAANQRHYMKDQLLEAAEFVKRNHDDAAAPANKGAERIVWMRSRMC